MNHVSLCTGIGGIDLAAEWAGFTSVAFCEIEPFCQNLLAVKWPGVPNCEKIQSFTTEFMERIGLYPGTTTLLSGGIPCQPYSTAGKQLGAEDDRAIWPEMLRVARLLKPHWILIENVAGFIKLALDGVLLDLAAEGYECGVYVLPACAVNAPHRRDRVFVVAYSKNREQPQFPASDNGQKGGGQTQKRLISGASGGSPLRDTSQRAGVGGRITQTIPEIIPNAYGVRFGSGSGHERTDPDSLYKERESPENSEYGNRWERGTNPLCETITDSNGRELPASGRTWDRRGQLTNSGSKDVSNAQSVHAGHVDNGSPAHKFNQPGEIKEERETIQESRIWHVEPGMDRTHDGISAGLDGYLNIDFWPDGWDAGIEKITTENNNRAARLKALGNSVVPAIIYPVVYAIAKWENSHVYSF